MTLPRRLLAGICAVPAAAVVLATAGASGSVASADPVAMASAVHRGFVTIISTRTNHVLARVRVGIAPNQIVATPDGRTAYVLSGYSATVTQIKDNGGSATTKAVHIDGYALGLAMAPDGKTVYVTRYTPSELKPSTQGFQAVNARTGIAARPVNLNPALGPIFGTITVLPDRRKLLLADSGIGRGREALLPVQIAHHRAGPRTDLFGCCLDQPILMLVTPNSKTAAVISDNPANGRGLFTSINLTSGTARKSLVLPAYVSAAMTPNGRLTYLADASDNTITVVRTATSRVITRLHINFPSSLAISPDGRTVWVGAADPVTGDPELMTISTARNTVSAPTTLNQLGAISALALAPNGRTAYFGITNGYIIPVNTATRTPGAPIRVGPNPTAIAFSRRGTMYVVARNNLG